MTTTIKIGSAGAGRDFATIQAAWNSLPATLTDHYIFSLYNDSEFTAGLTTSASAKTMAGFTVTIQPATGQGFRDNVAVTTNALRYNASNGVSIRQALQGAGVFNINVQGIYLVGLQVFNDNNSGGGFCVESTQGWTGTNCIFQAYKDAGGPVVKDITTLINCVVVQFNPAGSGASASQPSSLMRNNTVLYAGTGTSTGGGIGIAYNSGHQAIGNAIFGFSVPLTAYSTSYAAGTDYNATDQSSLGTSIPGTHNLVSLVASNQLQSLSAGAVDARIKSGSALIGAGTYNATMDPDILGQTRNATTPSIGAAELVAPPTPVINTPVQTLTAVNRTTSGATLVSGVTSGTLYALARTGGSAATAATIKASGQSNATTGTGAKTVPNTVLATGTANQYVDLVYNDATNSDSNVVTVGPITTASALSFSGPVSTQTVTSGNSVDIDLSTYFSGTGFGTLSYSNIGTALTGTGLTLNTTTGHITGTAGTEQTVTGVQVQKTDGGSPASTAQTNTFNLVINAAVDTTPPTMTGSITVSNLTSTSYKLDWSAATDNVSVTSYEVSLDSGSTYTDIGLQLTYSVFGRTPGTSDGVRVRAKDAAGNVATPLSSTVNLPATGGDSTPPTLSGVITSSAITTSGFTASWSAATDNVAVVGYEYSLNNGTTWIILGNLLTVSVTGRSPASTTQFRVRAFDAAGNRSASLFLAITTLDTSVTTSTLSNGSGTPVSSTLLRYSYFPGGRIGALSSITSIDGTVTSGSNGVCTINGLPSGSGVLMIAYYATSGTSNATTDLVYYEAITVA
jgi:hypothetical protein